MKKTPPAWHLLLAFVLTLAFLAGLIGWLQNVHIFTTNGMFKSILTEPWIHDPVNASLDHSNYLYYPLYGRLCAMLDFLGFMRGQAWRQFAYLNAFWASIGSVFVYAFTYRLTGSAAASAGATVFHLGSGFAQLEVLQSEVVDGVPVLLWCVGFNELCDEFKEKFGAGGVFSCTGESAAGPFNLRGATRFPHESLYAARLVQHQGQWYLIGFRNYEDGHFIGELCDPIPVTADPEHGLWPSLQ